MDSLLIVLFFIGGLALSLSDWLPTILLEHDFTIYALWLLMALLGLSLGADRKFAEILRSLRLRLLLLPLATTVGTFLGACLGAYFLVWTVSDCLAIGAGFAYYSLSSVFITQYKGADLGAAALLCNVFRELFTLLFTPLLIKFFGPPAAISSGGATTMDTTLPIIAKSAGPQWVFPAILHAMILDFSVPFWVTLFCSL